jgi:hypothetical protein
MARDILKEWGFVNMATQLESDDASKSEYVVVFWPWYGGVTRNGEVVLATDNKEAAYERYLKDKNQIQGVTRILKSVSFTLQEADNEEA